MGVVGINAHQKLMGCQSTAQHTAVKNVRQKARYHRLLCVQIRAILQVFLLDIAQTTALLLDQKLLIMVVLGCFSWTFYLLTQTHRKPLVRPNSALVRATDDLALTSPNTAHVTLLSALVLCDPQRTT